MNGARGGAFRLLGVHYAWVIAATAMLVVLGAVGLARFAFGMLLPAMAQDLALDYREQGILGASYFLGYLAMVASMPWLAPKLGSRRLCTGGLALVAVSLLAMSLGRGYLYLSLSYFAVGLGSGAAFIGAMSLPAFWFHPSHRARAAGVATAGAGIGILFSGVLVPQMAAQPPFAPWQAAWLVFAALALGFSLLAGVMLRNRPADVGLEPYGRPSARTRARRPRAVGVKVRTGPFVLHLGLIYALFAATGLTYTTFIVTTMVDALGVPAATAGLLWALVGGLSIFSGALFGAVSDRFGHRVGMAAALAVQAVAYALLAAAAGRVGLYVSLTLFGLSAWSMPSIVAAAAGDYLGPERAAAGFAMLTLMFAAGQVLGPAGAGFLADWRGGFASSFGVASGLNCLAVCLCMFLRRPAGTDNAGRDAPR